MSIAVLIPTFRRPDDLRRCLRGLAAQLRPPDDVIVVVRHDDDDTCRALQESDGRALNVRQLTVSEPGQVAALTAGLDAVSGDIVAITDDDAIARPDWLARIERHFQSDAAVGAVGGRDWVHTADGVLDDARSEVGRVRWYGRIIGNHHLGVGAPRSVDVLKGANMSFRISALGDIRPDSRLLGQGAQVHSDLGLCLALSRRRWKIVYDPAVAVDHHPTVRFDEDARGAPSLSALAHTAHNELYLLLRWLPGWRKLVALAYALLVGNRQLPGLVTFAERLVHGANARAVTEHFRAAQRGRLTAILTALGRRGPHRAG